MKSEHVGLLRHFLATLAYRLDKVLVNAPENFGNFDAGNGARKPAEILAHMEDVLIWGSGRITGVPRELHTPGSWDEEIVRFGTIITTFNRALAEWPEPEAQLARKLLQGPLADAMTHVGQLAMLSRLAGNPIAPENFYEAPVAELQVKD